MARPSGGRAMKRGKKNRKWGRNKKSCEDYRREDRERLNRIRRLRRHLKKLPEDRCAYNALRRAHGV